jgi:hypothetical protein
LQMLIRTCSLISPLDRLITVYRKYTKQTKVRKGLGTQNLFFI